MARITKVDYDKNFPYIIEDGWGGKVCCTKDDLIDLQKAISKILEPPKPQPRIQQCGNIGGMIIRKMIENIEKGY